MAKGFKLGGGGGGVDLNFAIVGGTQQPAAPKENTLWVNTDQEITAWAFSADAPVEPVEGMVWFRIGTVSTTPINVLKKNTAMVYPYGAAQYLSGSWQEKAAMVYQNGQWKSWTVYLLKDGVLNEAVTGGITGTVSNGVITFPATSIDLATNKTYSTKQPIDLRKVNTVRVLFKPKATNTNAHCYFRVVVLSAPQSGANVNTSNAAYVAHADINGGQWTTGADNAWSVDVSHLQGEFYLGYAWGVYTAAGSAKTLSGEISRWWLE